METAGIKPFSNPDTATNHLQNAQTAYGIA